MVTEQLDITTASSMARRDARGDAAPHLSGRLRAVVLLAASLRPTPLTAAIGRSLLDLPIERDRTLLDLWSEHVGSLAASIGTAPLPLRILRDGDTPAARPSAGAGAAVSVEVDPAEYRGTAGVLRDVTGGYDDADRVLVVNAAQYLVEPLRETAVLLETVGGGGGIGGGGGVSMVAHEDGTPSGAMLVTCGCLRLVPSVGFFDMKEQALPLIAKHYPVRVVSRRELVSKPIRSLSEYIGVLRWHHLTQRADPLPDDPFREDWRPVFTIVEDGSDVDARATVQDSVVLRGGRVEGGAIVVRSLVAPGATVRRGEIVVDRLVGAGVK
jgi:hypothetical protein